MDSPDTLSYWQASAPTPPPADPLPARADIVVVGGGVLGAAAAYFAARDGARVALVEQRGLAWGASGRNGGFITEGAARSYRSAVEAFGRDAARRIWQLTAENRGLARQVIGGERIDCWYREPGHLDFALSAEEADMDAANAAEMRADGFAADYLTRDQTQSLVGTELGPTIHGAKYASYAGLVHSTRLVAGLGAAARRRGAALCAATVTAVEPGRVVTDAGAIETAGAVVAANAWISQLVPAARDAIVPVRGQALCYEPIAPALGPGMGTSMTPTGEYWQQTLDGTIVIGGCRAAQPGREVGVLRHDTTPDVQQAIEGVLPTLFPALRGLRVSRRWAGPMAFTPDYLPVADRAPEAGNTWYAGGFCGHGMPFGLIFGQLLARAALGGASSDLDLFSISRFARR